MVAGVAHCPGQENVLGRGWQQVLAPGHMGDLIVDVIDGRGEVMQQVGRPSLRRMTRAIDVGRFEADPVPHHVIECHRRVLGDGKPDRTGVESRVQVAYVVRRMAPLAPGRVDEAPPAPPEPDRRRTPLRTPRDSRQPPCNGRTDRIGGRSRVGHRLRPLHPSPGQASGSGPQDLRFRTPESIALHRCRRCGR